MFKFIHAADIHLDSPLKGLERYEGAPDEEIRGATRRALENLVKLAIEREVDFVLIAGDLYDGDWKDHNTGLFFVKQMSRLRKAEIPVIMISGNHDAANKMTKKLRLPDNVELLSYTRPKTAKSNKLHELGVAVHGRSFAKAAEYDNMARDYPERDSGLYNIGLLHTSLAGAEGHEPYAPCTIDELRQKQYDYWALGHVHNREIVSDDPLIVFCGNIQGRHIREMGAKGCYLVSVDEQGKAELDFQPLDVLRWDVCEVPIADAQRAEDVLDSFSTRLSVLNQTHEGMPLAIRVVVTGRSLVHEQLVTDPIGWTNQVRSTALDLTGGNVWVEKVKFQTLAARVSDGTEPVDGPIGELLRYVSELRDNEPQLKELSVELADLRHKLPNELTSGEDALALDDPNRLREWLDEVQPLLLSRLDGTTET